MNSVLNINEQIVYAAQLVRNGGVVAFPTDTFYGLGANPFNPEAIEKIYQIKHRPSDKAIILLISALDGLKECVNYARFTPKREALFTNLITHFWPGPLTIILPASEKLPDNLVSAQKTVGVRYPNYLLTQQLTQAVGGIITATSANLSGQPNTQNAQEVATQLANSVDYILDGGDSPGGQPSTLIDLTTTTPTIVREGAISRTVLMAYIDSMVS